MTARIQLRDALSSLPQEWPENPLPAIQAAIAETGQKLVVVDDDPMGTQTVAGVSVLFDWSTEALQTELRSDYPALFAVTNSRSMTPAEADRINFELGSNLRDVSFGTSPAFTVINRGDSTLRGHFPGEFRALERGLGIGFDAWILMPFFFEGGRYTVDNVHYVSDGEWLTPVGQTEFARDPAFPFTSSDLRRWLQETTNGDVTAGDVVSISIKDIREGGPGHVAGRLCSLTSGQTCIVNAASMRDAEVFALATICAERRGKRFLYRTAASFIRARLGQAERPLLTDKELEIRESGGLLVFVGSITPQTTAQLEHLLSATNIHGIGVHVRELLSDRSESHLRSVAAAASRLLIEGEDVVIYTSRERIEGATPAETVAIGQRVSDSLVSLLRSIDASPRAMVSKGGMTTYNIASRALGVRRAIGLGQIAPGIPVWRLTGDSRSAGMPLVLFPGNVGQVDSLSRVVNSLGKTHSGSRADN